MAKTFKATWYAPASILGGLLAGILLSVGHHLYYASLEGTTPEGDKIIAGYRLSNQTFTTAVGTTFALIVRAILLFAISGAYVQVLWQVVTHTRKVNTLEEIDAMFSILSDVFAFRRGSVWWKYPVLSLVAIIAWLLPIAFIIPPASLSVIVAPVTDSALNTVPNFDFASLRYVAGMPMYNYADESSHGDVITYSYNGPSTEVQKVANAVADGGNILPITPPTANSSWQLEFYGPSLSCHLMDDDTRLQAESEIAYSLWNETSTNCYFPYGYLAWSWTFGDGTDPLVQINSNLSTYQIPTSSCMAIMPDLLDISGDWDSVCNRVNLTTPSQPLGPGNMTFLQCDLHNSSYHVAFNYEPSRQSVTVDASQNEVVPAIRFLSFSNTSDPVSDVYNATLLRQLSYTAVADAFYQIIRGGISNDIRHSSLQVESKIISTVLLDTPELGFLSSLYGLSPSASTLQTDLWNTNTSRGQSLSSPQNVKLQKSLQSAMEEMFQNITISLISSELLQPNMTSEFAPPMANVTTITYGPVYQYSSRDLWISYGVTVAVSAVASFIGLSAIYFNNASYSDSFSSIYRTAHSAKLNVKMRAEDMNATDPLPRYLAKAALCIANPNSTTQLVHGGDQKAPLATTGGATNDTLIESGTKTAAGQDDEPRVANDSNPSSTELSIGVTR
ncbi:hypothetical protein F4678DRAFT_89997 [Xylaria arbuscula]|nr:hypothetical protein F4678DRAFT_89997 [Xylaria arbuscula]